MTYLMIFPSKENEKGSDILRIPGYEDKLPIFKLIQKSNSKLKR